MKNRGLTQRTRVFSTSAPILIAPILISIVVVHAEAVDTTAGNKKKRFHQEIHVPHIHYCLACVFSMYTLFSNGSSSTASAAQIKCHRSNVTTHTT